MQLAQEELSEWMVLSSSEGLHHRVLVLTDNSLDSPVREREVRRASGREYGRANSESSWYKEN